MTEPNLKPDTCHEECLVDVRIPVTVEFDFSVHGVKLAEIELVIERLESAVVEARMESLVDIADLMSGTRWNPAQADMENIGVRSHGRSGSFYPWSRKKNDRVE